MRGTQAIWTKSNICTIMSSSIFKLKNVIMKYHIATWVQKARSFAWGAFGSGSLLLLARPARALEFDPGSTFKTETELGDLSPIVVAANILSLLLTLLGILLVLLILWAGFNWMTAGGNEEKVKNARQTLQRAIIGLLIVLASYGISKYVFEVLLEATGG